MNLRQSVTSHFMLRAFELTAVGIVVVLAPVVVRAQVSVTESFDLGAGTRFDLFLNNDVVRPRPGSLVPSENPADDEFIDDAFGGQRMFVDGEGNIVTNHFGFTGTNNAAGMGVGEFGGEFNWFDYGGVADTTLGGELNPSHEVVIQATMRIDDIGFDNDQRVTLGYYELPTEPVPADFQRGRIIAGIGFVGGARFLLQINGNNSDPINIPGGFDSDTGFTNTFDVDLTLKFDPAQGEDGVAWFEGMVAGIPINQFTFSNPADVGDPFDSFAIAQSFRRESQDAYRRGAAWIDDLAYSVVTDLGIDTPDPPRIDSPSDDRNGGDYNADGVVNAADYAVWRDNLGSSGTPGAVLGDGTGDDLAGVPDGDADQFDYDFWKQEFGSVLPAGVALTANTVPEPTTLYTLLFATPWVAVRRSHRWRMGASRTLSRREGRSGGT